jgi:hypothetical protein
MGTLFVDKLDPQSGTSLEIGSSGDTMTVPSGATLSIAGTINASSGTATGFGTAGTESFLAILSSNQTVSDNASTLVAFDTESYDVGSNYTNTSSNYKYTVPSAGKYRFYSTIAGATDGSYAVNNVFLKLVKNGSTVFMISSDTHQDSHAPDVATTQIDITLDCSANDYFQIYGQVNTTGSGISTQNFYSDSSRRTFFGGYRIA